MLAKAPEIAKTKIWALPRLEGALGNAEPGVPHSDLDAGLIRTGTETLAKALRSDMNWPSTATLTRP